MKKKLNKIGKVEDLNKTEGKQKKWNQNRQIECSY